MATTRDAEFVGDIQMGPASYTVVWGHSGAGPIRSKHKTIEAIWTGGKVWYIRAITILAVFVGAAVILTRVHIRKKLLQYHPDVSIGLNAESYCGWMERNVQYTGKHLAELVNVSDPGACCTKCQNDPKCRAWTWSNKFGTVGSSDCTLKSIQPDKPIIKVQEFGVVSGLPDQWTIQHSLFCFALMLPFSYEQDLLKMQHANRTSIFACDEYTVYSNQSIEIVIGLNTSVVDSDLQCKKGGEFKTALNTNIFLAVWRKVASDGRFKFNDWTVKVDPDCVFFPSRLRVAVQFHKDSKVYLNNCRFGLHGPIEVFSRLAVEAWILGMTQCVRYFEGLCKGPCGWGEDMFIDQCLFRVLKVKRANDWNILSEDHCDSKDWNECKNGRVAFHPFKSTVEYTRCIASANGGALPITG